LSETVIIIKGGDDAEGTFGWVGYLQEWVNMGDGGLAFLAIVKILADGALVSDPDDRSVATVAFVAFVDCGFFNIGLQSWGVVAQLES